MAYQYTNSKSIVYYLNSKDVVLRGKQHRKIYFFSKDIRNATSCDSVPADYEVAENKVNGFPVLRKKK